MKCEICGCQTYIIHINQTHEKVCSDCFQENEKTKRMPRSENKGERAAN